MMAPVSIGCNVAIQTLEGATESLIYDGPDHTPVDKLIIQL